MFSHMSSRSVVSAAILALSFAALPSAASAVPFYGIQVNGTCDTGVCDFTNPAPFNTNSTQTVSLSVTLGDGDMFAITGSLGVQNNSNGSLVNTSTVYQVTYLGDGNGGTSQADTISVNSFLATATALSGGNFDAGAVGFLGAGLGAGSSAQFSGVGNGLNGPALSPQVTAPGPFDADYDYPMAASGGDFKFEMSSISIFGAGSAVGSAMVFGAETAPVPVTTPEPASIGLFVGALVVLSGLRRRTRHG